MHARRLALVLVGLMVLAVGLACTAESPVCCPESDPPLERGDGALRVLAGSELKDLAELKDGSGQTIIDQIRTRTGVSVSLSYVGTLDGIAQVIGGQAAQNYDAIWFPSNRYLGLYPEASGRIGEAVPIMRSPVVVGVRSTVADALWPGVQPGWKDIAAKAQAGQLDFAMTDPAASNSGFSALLAMATALSSEEGALTIAQIQAAAPALRALFSAQQLTAGSSGWLKDAYLRRMRDGAPIDAMINYESVLLSANADARATDKLTLIYPPDGVLTADYPLTLLTGRPDAGEKAATNHRIVSNYLRREEAQRSLMELTHRRPVRSTVELSPGFGRDAPREVEFPTSVDVVNALIRAFGDTIRTPPRTIYVLDLSGSMEEKDAPDPTSTAPDRPRIARIDALRHALLSLTGADASLSGQFTVFHEREQVVLLTFATAPQAPRRFEIPPGQPEAELGRVSSFVTGMKIGGRTAIYDALAEAYRLAAEPTAEPRYTTIVLFSDGEHTEGRDLAGFRSLFAAMSPAQKQVPVFSVMIGEGNAAELTVLSRQITNGEFFDARNVDSLAKVFQEIRGYQ